MFSCKNDACQKIVHVHDWEWIGCEIYLSIFYYMLKNNKYVDVWFNSLHRNMAYMINVKA
jgi:hypothetical protein